MCITRSQIVGVTGAIHISHNLSVHENAVNINT